MLFIPEEEAEGVLVEDLHRRVQQRNRDQQPVIFVFG